MQTAAYLQQAPLWPSKGRGILAQFDSESVVVYQAYKPSIGQHAARHATFGPDFSMRRMTWIKPNFLWMMYRCGWGTKVDQEVTLAIRVSRTFFDTLLQNAVASSFEASWHADAAEWSAAVESSDVRLQWDPDHDPRGAPLARRAIQLGIRGATLEQYVRDAIVAVDDVSDFVAAQRQAALSGAWEALETPVERPYPVQDAKTRANLALDW